MRALDRGEVIPAKISQSPSETSSLASAPTSVGDALVGAAGRHQGRGSPPRRSRANGSARARAGRRSPHPCGIDGPHSSAPRNGTSAGSGSRGALLRPGPLRTVHARHPSTRLKQAGQSPSACRDPSSGATALGPFTTEAASNLSSGSHASPTSPSGSPDPVSILSGPGTSPFRPVIQDRAGGGRRHANPRFAVAFRRTGIRFWVILSR
jgi:hypothetical protein